MNKKNIFDQYASGYDAWFMDNKNLLMSEVNLVAHFLKGAGRIFSVGCGSGLFESILKKEFDIVIQDGLEPSDGMAAIARKRGINVTVTTAEEATFGSERYDTILFNGTPSYINNLEGVIQKVFKALKRWG
ncbi:MAG: class I SAM-dependent methyltransferase, partial [Bacteroidaceae bacterium]|nr:class I SAM-dependent methyltransferase [Bacteroidaceae bacterium]